MIVIQLCLPRTGNNEVITFRAYIKGNYPLCKKKEFVL